MSNVCVSGSSGFIGSHLCNKLVELGHKVTPLDRTLGQDVNSHIKSMDMDYVFHLAARHHIATCEKEYQDCLETNVWGTMNMMKQYPNARFINISSSSVMDIRSVYGASKACGEVIAKLHKNCLTVRFYNVFGEGQTLEGGAAIPKFIHHFLTKKKLTVFGDGEQARDFTYVGDVIENLVELAFGNRVGLASIGYGVPITVNNMIKLIYGSMPEIEYIKSNSFDILFSKSPEKCVELYGRELGIQRTIKWFKEHYHL